MPKKSKISFLDKSFCFTGKMSEIKRKDAEQEVRARGGLTHKNVGPTLDYLVVGDVPSPSWLHGKFGRKIKKALDYKKMGKRKPRIVSESDFLSDLALTPPTNAGEIDSQVLVCTYRSPFSFEEEAGQQDLESLADQLSETGDCFVSIKLFPTDIGFLLTPEDGLTISEGWEARVRIIKVTKLGTPSEPFFAHATELLEQCFGDAGEVTLSVQKEGAALYTHYLRQLPKETRVQILASGG